MTAAIEPKLVPADLKAGTKEYYAFYSEASYRSAMRMLPKVFELLGTPSVIRDYGCGTGEWLEAALHHGAEKAFGYEQEDVDIRGAKSGPRYYTSTQKMEHARLTLCLEVAEHIEEPAADSLIFTLTQGTDAVLFSAAIPGQGGAGHVNEQWPSYWAKLFDRYGFEPIDFIRDQVWDDEAVSGWYRQNCILYVAKDVIAKRPVLQAVKRACEGRQLDRVHPGLYIELLRRHSEDAAAASDRKHIFLGVPTHDGKVDNSTFSAVMRTAASRHDVSTKVQCSSALTHNFNELWLEALRGVESHGVTHFCMLHADVGPLQQDWIDRLVAIMEEGDYDLVSVIIPIKDDRGLTSTGFDTDPWRPRRLSMHEAMQMPATFDNDAILKIMKPDLSVTDMGDPIGPIIFNTGLWICRLDRPWVKKICFDIKNRVHQYPDTDQIVAEFAPEDWEFSRQCYELGVKYAVTRAIEVEHIGRAAPKNTHAWGSMKRDERNIEHWQRMSAIKSKSQKETIK